MRVLYIYCHPLPESFHAGVRAEALKGLAEGGHTVDLLDLYAEGFDPVLTEGERRHYHDTAVNRHGLEGYVARIQAAEVLVLQFPTWTFGPPAMLKGFFDRLLMPGVAFDISDPKRVRPLLTGVKRTVGIVTYGRPLYMVWWMANPSKKLVTRYIRWLTGGARADFHALYHMNTASAEVRDRFKRRIRHAMVRL